MSEPSSPAVVPFSFATFWQRYYTMAVLSGLSIVLVWSYWNSLERLATQVWESSKYSNGYLVPLFTLVLLWLRRDPSIVVPPQMTSLGAGLLGVGLAIAVGAQGRILPDVDERLLVVSRQVGIAMGII